MVRTFCFVLLFLLGLNCWADVNDPFDTFQQQSNQSTSLDPDKDKSAEELLDEATMLLFQDERPLDARSKLLKVLAKNPKEFRAHMLLAGYYMEEVGHFRLALRYVKQAKALFEEANGNPPYADYVIRSQHDHLLYLLSQARLNLDDYEGALQVLDEYVSYGYYRDWFPGSKAWILMKLGRIDEAIKVARLGIIAGAEPGRTLNMLGILLSMHDEREDSLKIFKQAVEYELSLGKLGRPATPLNNAGEVYEEVFRDEMAESSWLKATRMPDGCEHVLPSLNLALLYLDQLKLQSAKQAMDSFISCVAQFPLRNGEEHKSLEALARGRIALHSGHPAEAVLQFNTSLEKQQWFGKIGTNPQDLQAGALISLGQALLAQNNQLAFRRFKSWQERINWLTEVSYNKILAWWSFRRARQILSQDLNNLEDLYIRHTDSMIEYSTFGQFLATFPRRLLERRVDIEEHNDTREAAQPYYQAYLAESLISGGYPRAGLDQINSALSHLRADFDQGLRLRLLLVKLGTLEEDSSDYRDLAVQIYNLSKAALRNNGFRLPVMVADSLPQKVWDELAGTAFILHTQNDLPFEIVFERNDNEYVLRFISRKSSSANITVKASDLRDAVNKLTDEVFSIGLA